MKYSPHYYLLFHIIPGLAMMYLQLVSIDGLTVQVSEHGRDVQSCLHGSIPCKTLTYALCLIETAKITNVPYASVTVNVTSNQTINTYNTYYFSSSSVSKITVVGYNGSSLYFQDSASLWIKNSSNSGLTWTWVDLGFVQISTKFSICVACDICGSVLTHVGVDGNTLNILQCKFISIGWNITDIQNIIINGSVFGTTVLACVLVCAYITQGILTTRVLSKYRITIFITVHFQAISIICLFFQTLSLLSLIKDSLLLKYLAINSLHYCQTASPYSFLDQRFQLEEILQLLFWRKMYLLAIVWLLLTLKYM